MIYKSPDGAWLANVYPDQKSNGCFPGAFDSLNRMLIQRLKGELHLHLQSCQGPRDEHNLPLKNSRQLPF